MHHHPHVLVADDHTDTRNLLCGILQTEFDVVADVADGLALVTAAEREWPDVIVTDISMPGLNGIAAARQILGSNPAARIVFVTIHAESTMVENSLATGALGYVLKMSAGDELLPAVHAALAGKRYVSQALRDQCPSITTESILDHVTPHETTTSHETETMRMSCQCSACRHRRSS